MSRRKTALMIAALALVPAACGSSSSDGSAPERASASSTTGPRSSTSTTSTSSTSTSTTTTAAPTTTVPPRPDIHDVDLPNATFPAGSCYFEQTNSGWPSDLPFKLSGGAGTTGAPPRDEQFVELKMGGPITYGDIDGDGIDEAATLVTCSAGTTGASFGVVLDWDGKALALAGSEALGTVLARFGDVTAVKIAGDEVQVTEAAEAVPGERGAPTGMVPWQVKDGTWTSYVLTEGGGD